MVTTSITDPEDAYGYGRTSADKVYAQIIQDLKDAEAVLPVKYTVNTDIGRATKGAAKGLLGKVYLTMHNYPDAISELSGMLNLGYTLLPNYNDIFLATNGNNAEIVFSVQYTKGGYGTGSPFANIFLPGNSGNNIVKVGAPAGFNLLTQDLVDAFSDPADKRKAISVGVYLGGNYYTQKYMDTPTGAYDAENDWIVLRYADVLLMYAEALNENGQTSDAVPYLNQIRTRAGLANISSSINQSDLRLAIEKDRRLELNMEGHRWFDLVRTGRAITVMNASFNKYKITIGVGVNASVANNQLLFPIPLSEIQINPLLTQNPGY